MSFIEPFFERSAKYIKIPMSRETNAIDKFERRISSKKLGIINFIQPPKKTIGIVPIKIDLNIFKCKKYSNNFFEYWLLNLKISHLKYQNIAKTLPNWIIADAEEPGSSIPKRGGITFKWAVLLIGINSVKPWIKPYKINSKYSNNL